MPRSRMVLESSSETHCGVIAVMDAPSGGFRLVIAIFSASSASSAVMLGPVDRPAMRRDHMSITSARYSQPWRVLT